MYNVHCLGRVKDFFEAMQQPLKIDFFWQLSQDEVVQTSSTSIEDFSAVDEGFVLSPSGSMPFDQHFVEDTFFQYDGSESGFSSEAYSSLVGDVSSPYYPDPFDRAFESWVAEQHLVESERLDTQEKDTSHHGTVSGHNEVENSSELTAPGGHDRSIKDTGTEVSQPLDAIQNWCKLSPKQADPDASNPGKEVKDDNVTTSQRMKQDGTLANVSHAHGLSCLPDEGSRGDIKISRSWSGTSKSSLQRTTIDDKRARNRAASLRFRQRDKARRAGLKRQLEAALEKQEILQGRIEDLRIKNRVMHQVFTSGFEVAELQCLKETAEGRTGSRVFNRGRNLCPKAKASF